MILGRFLFRFLQGKRLAVAAAILMTLVQALADVFIAFPLKFILDKLLHHRDPSFPVVNALVSYFDRFGTRNALNLTEVHSQISVIAASSVMLVVLGLTSALMSYGQMLVAVDVGQHLGVTVKNRVFAHLQRLPLSWHARNRTGDLVQRLTSNVSDLEKLVTDGLVDLLSGFLTLVGIISVMLWLNWQFTLICMGIIPAMFAVVFSYTRRIKRATRAAAKAGGEVADVANEDLTAMVEVKGFGLQQREIDIFSDKVRTQRNFAFRAGRLAAEFAPLVLMLVAISNAVTISVGAWVASGHGRTFALFPGLRVGEGTLTIGALTVFLAYSKQLYQPLRNLSKLLNLASTGSSAAERITAVLEAAPEVDNAPAGVTPQRIEGSIGFEGITFGYEKDRPVLHNISLEIPAGRRIALVGLSGSGKTTLVSLLPRFFEPDSGVVTIGGRDVRELPIDTLRRNVGLVLQTSMLLEGTIRENIAIGRPEATDEEIREAARRAYIAEEIEALPNGYDARVREQGLNFSAGQRQRLAIARAVLLDAPILILDEPTANLDVEAEGKVMEAIADLVIGRTVIMITHRLSTLGNVDDVVVMKGGRIVEAGPVDALSRGHGEFSRLLTEQSRYSANRFIEPAARSDSGEGVRVNHHASRTQPSNAAPHLWPASEPAHRADPAPTLGTHQPDGVAS